MADKQLLEQAQNARAKGTQAFHAGIGMPGTRKGISLLWEATTALGQASELYKQAGDARHAAIMETFCMRAYDWHFDQLEAWLDDEETSAEPGWLEVMADGRLQWHGGRDR